MGSEERGKFFKNFKIESIEKVVLIFLILLGVYISLHYQFATWGADSDTSIEISDKS